MHLLIKVGNVNFITFQINFQIPLKMLKQNKTMQLKYVYLNKISILSFIFIQTLHANSFT